MQSSTADAKRIAHAIRDMVGGKFAFNQFIKICEESGLIYFSNPHASAGRTTASLNIAIASLAGKATEFSNAGSMNAAIGNSMLSPAQFGIPNFGHAVEDPGFVKFTFVRDPVDRFFSAFFGKLDHKGPQTSMRERLYRHLEIEPSYKLGFEELASILAEDSETLEHIPFLRPQRRIIAYDIVEFDYIGRHENWETDFDTITADIFGSPLRKFDPMLEFGRDIDNVKTDIEINATTRAALMKAYESDYEMLEEISQSQQM